MDMEVAYKEDLLTSFAEAFSFDRLTDVRVFFAPGRVNLIGEHTDYNGGYVFPGALTNGTYMVIKLRDDGEYHLRSANFDTSVVFRNSDLRFDPKDDWGNYPKGIIAELAKLGVDLPGATIYFYGNIPNGAGLSSSASIGMVTAYGLTQCSGVDIDRVTLAKLCQRMENDFIGVSTGLMDQFAVGMGKKDHALFLNTSTLEYDQVPLILKGYKLVITNSNKRRGLADSKYNERRRECEMGLEQLRKKQPNLSHLGEVTEEMFAELGPVIEDELIYRRVRHVVTEDARVLAAVSALKAGELQTFGELMKASHLSLREDYDVTGVELDTLFDLQASAPGCIGTRMTGAGFGGCTVSIVHEEEITAFQTVVSKGYEKKIGYKPTFYVTELGDGVNEWKGGA